ERGLSENTFVNYEMDILKFCHFLEAHYPDVSPVNIQNIHLQEFIYQVALDLNPRSQARLISGLKSFFHFLIFEGYRKDDPTSLIDLPKIGRKLPDTLALEEINALITAIDLHKAEGERNYAMLETMYGCGLRVSELVALKISDLYFNEGFIKITGKGNKQRFVPVGEVTVNFIDKYLNGSRAAVPKKKGHEDTLFLNRRGAGLTRAMIFTIIKDLAVKINLQKNISPHTFRHSYATHLLENGADLRSIQLMLGHESITTTEIYVHLERSHLKKIMQEYHPRINM
ncbi:MAG: tyrosine recombinase XerD, partial [Flavobacterium sp.]|nr:tyrosine recombinase XerD [Candidatus Neoflavobacterium equi]